MNRTAKLCLAAVLLLAVLATPLTACGNKTPAAQTPSDQATAPSTSATTPSNAPKMSEIDLSDVTDVSQFHETDDVTDYVRMTVRYTMKNGTVRTGKIYIRLFPDVAPITVSNFQSLVARHFYDNLTFHRVYPGFMIQGGDPDGNGGGDSGITIKGEFSANGVENNLLHVRGVLSMARGNSMDSASCQFFIMHQESPSLNGSYASFGYVVNGMDVVDDITNIALTQTAGSIDKVATSPVNPVTILSVRFVTF